MSLLLVYSSEPQQQQTVITFGLIKYNKSCVEEVFDPWCPALNTSTVGKVVSFVLPCCYYVEVCYAAKVQKKF